MLEGTSDCTVELCFFFRNSALLLAFLLFVEGLTFFLVRASGRGAEAWLSLVSRAKEKVESILREKLKANYLPIICCSILGGTGLYLVVLGQYWMVLVSTW